ncbi:MAG TPA: hypothetical protein VGU64_08495 [Terriglobales bacterium]|nr:hypothetical protein [Terriglobales bacterium]
MGSQSLTGIASLHKLRNDPQLAGASAVWPFETGWATKQSLDPDQARRDIREPGPNPAASNFLSQNNCPLVI